MTKSEHLDTAEIFDSWRVVPRVIVLVYLTLLVWVTVYFSLSYFALPAVERTTQVTAFVSVVLTTAYGAFPFIVKIYGAGGRDWDAANRPPVVVNNIAVPP